MRRGALGVGERVRDRDAHVRDSRGARARRRRGSRTSACTIDVGWTTTSIRSYGSAEEEVRLDQLEPLVRERRRVDRDLRPHAPRRVRERLLAVTRVELVAARPRNGPPEAVRTSRVDGLRARGPRGTGTSAECSLSTGSSSPPPRSCARERELAGGDEALLVRERERDAALERPERRAEAGEADDRVQDDVRLARARAARSGRRRPGRARRRARRRAASSRRRARRERTSSSSGCASMTSIAWRPIEPVAPRRATRFTPQCAGAPLLSRMPNASDDVERRRRRRRGARRSRSSMPPWPASSRPESFTPRSRLSVDSKRSPSGAASATRAEDERLARSSGTSCVVERDERDGDGRERAGDEALPCLARRDGRRELVPADQRARRSTRPCRRRRPRAARRRREPAVLGDVAQEEQVAEPAADPGRRRAPSCAIATVADAASPRRR